MLYRCTLLMHFRLLNCDHFNGCHLSWVAVTEFVFSKSGWWKGTGRPSSSITNLTLYFIYFIFVFLFVPRKSKQKWVTEFAKWAEAFRMLMMVCGLGSHSNWCTHKFSIYFRALKFFFAGSYTSTKSADSLISNYYHTDCCWNAKDTHNFLLHFCLNHTDHWQQK